jgi:hypothetical protein
MMMRCNDDDAVGRSVAMASHSKEEILQCTVSGTFPSLQCTVFGISRLFNMRYTVVLAVEHPGRSKCSNSIFYFVYSTTVYTVVNLEFSR